MTTPSPYLHKRDPWSSHALALSWLRRLPAGARVLDVGCATGMLGRTAVGLPLALTGLEPNPQWATAARPFYQAVLDGSVDGLEDRALSGFDAVVCADVLEHLPDPQITLRRLAQLQPAGACFFVSVPNVANLYVRLSLLAGRFDYAERGILDRTHLRFFTRKTFLALLHGAGLQVQALHVTPIPLGLVRPFFLQNPAGRVLFGALAAASRALPTLLGYQFIAEAVCP